MVSSVLGSLVCVILHLAVCDDYCSSYWDTDGFYHDTQQCGFQYCCGDCDKKYCCSGQENHLTQEKQEGCGGRPSNEKQIRAAAVLGGIFASIFPIILCVVLIVCCVSPCCLFYKCRKGTDQRQQSRTNVRLKFSLCRKLHCQTLRCTDCAVVIYTTNAVNAPQQPVSSSGKKLSFPGYQPVLVLHGYGGSPTPTAPPHSYLEATDPARSPVPPPQRQPMYPLQPLGQPHAPPLHSDELAQPPYNPSYGPHP
ncbi:protein shisa-4-like [Xiphias gladius]|uniref:protein shisa-4-like n=1 Tax=Xiphias gladius TaxID=8245 RepID=UPI001A9817BD|nr:protein shisa-4-like [Xiphias gladius]